MKRPTNLVKRGSVYYYRHKVQGRSKWLSLRTGSYSRAKELLDEIKTKQVLAAAGYGDGPRIGKRMGQLGDVLKFYRDAGCPRKNNSKREGKPLQLGEKAIENLTRHLGRKDPHQLTPADWHRYADSRLAEYTGGKGARTIDLAWSTLSSAFRHAIRYQDERGIRSRPLAERPERIRVTEHVNHCRQYQPKDGEELHNIARYFMERQESVRRGSAVFGWLTLLSAMIGQRGSEMLHLRSDAQSPEEPGYDDGEHLWLYRSTTHKGTAPFIKVTDELRTCLAAHTSWKRVTNPTNPWFFPSPRKTGEHLETTSFRQALERACHKLQLPKRTVHGLRSYYVNVLRSRGVSDTEIALQIGHKSGGKLIVETYGEILTIKLDWMPTNEPPAWEAWEGSAPIAKPQFA